MKLFVAFAALVAAVSGKRAAPARRQTVELRDIKADSPLGNKVMEHARRLDQNQEVDYTWVAGYSIKFQGCHQISQWNAEADGEEDVKIQTKRLVRFRLCPEGSCSTENAGGCDSGYGEYILDMNIFLEAWLQAEQEHFELLCEQYAYTQCQNNDDEDTCLWDYLTSIGMDPYKCVDKNPYNEEEGEEEAFEWADYMECAKYEFQNNNRRQLDQAEEVEYFMGPYCADNGGAIYLGLFTDDQCTIFADDYGGKETFYTNSAGTDMPFYATSVIDYDCISCKEPQEDNNGGDDAQDADEVIDFCEQIYQQAGKCETGLSSAGISNLNENACNYMEGIKVVRKNGVVQQNSSKANKTASIFIGIFVVAFVLLAAYVYYLKTKLDRASINLAE
mmetsp:Transcript_18861/g.34127  ORF Transcript_18861/g.34127 Transcript_18861/m.34127 type:complete len:390 (-) Transcript_18861:145-1314(-)